MSTLPADGSLPTDPPLRVDDPDSQQWDRETDLLVVGLGAAGAAAAISAREQGCDVLALDRFGMGGATARSGGVVYAGGGTPQQKKAGVEDSVEDMFRYLQQEADDSVSDDTLRRFCEQSSDTINWLTQIGAAFDGATQPPKTSYPKNGVFLYYSGNEAIKPFCDTARPAPRGHRTVDAGLSGKALYNALEKRVRDLGIPVETPCSARRLIVDAQGVVVGAEALRLYPSRGKRFLRLAKLAEVLNFVHPPWADALRRRLVRMESAASTPIRIRARRGVALCTGGFVFNYTMLSEHAPAYERNLRLGTNGCDGAGIRLGQSVGGATDRMHKVSAWRFINPPTSWPQGAVVNAQGERFCNEMAYGARLGVMLCEEHEGRAWLILDNSLRKQALREALTGGLWIFQSAPAFLLMLFAKRARTPAALAHKLGIAPEPFCATMNRYNLIAEGQAEDALGKQPETMSALKQAPYYAINISATNRNFPCPAITLGGLRVNEETGAVLNESGGDIPGLYAAGRAAVGVASNGYVSGLSLADCFFSGRRIGEALAADDQ